MSELIFVFNFLLDSNGLCETGISQSPIHIQTSDVLGSRKYVNFHKYDEEVSGTTIRDGHTSNKNNLNEESIEKKKGKFLKIKFLCSCLQNSQNRRPSFEY